MNNNKIINIVSILALATIFIGSVLSAFDICTGGCSETKNYRLFGMAFWKTGLAYSFLLAASWWHKTRANSGTPFNILIATGLGMEIIFVGIQANQIKAWCPVCLTIMGALVLLFIVSTCYSFVTLYKGKGGLQVAKQIVIVLVALLIGFAVGSPSISKAELPTGNVWFGNSKSDINIYFVTDWFCPHCQKTEAHIEGLNRKLALSYKTTFVDYPINQESYNYLPYHVALLTKHKDKYFEGRTVLAKFATDKIQSPTYIQVVSAMKQAGIVDYTPADYYTTISNTEKYKQHVLDGGVFSTPTILVQNTKNKKSRVLSGSEAFDLKIINKAISEVQ